MRIVELPVDDRIVEMSYPTKVVFGVGALQRLPAHVERLGMNQPLLVTDAGVVTSGLARRALDVLTQAGIRHSETKLAV